MTEYDRLLTIIESTPFNYAVDHLKKNENFLCALELTNEELHLYLIYKGDATPIYYCFWKKELLFHGTDYKPAITTDWDSLECVVTLLSFLLLKPGSVDSDFFKDYNGKQKEFIETKEAENLRLLSDYFIYENGLSESESTEYFTQHFIQG